MKKLKCKKEVMDGWRSRPCSRSAVKDGFCGIHHPDAVTKRNEKSQAIFEASMAKLFAPKLEVERLRKGLRELRDWLDDNCDVVADRKLIAMRNTIANLLGDGL